jgi:hypothetical protein
MTTADTQPIACALTPSCACASSAKSAAKEPAGAKAAGAAAMTLSTSGLACVACCVLPFTLPATILASTGALLSAFIHMRWWLLALSVIAVITAWGWLGWQIRQTGRKPSTGTLTMMTVSTLLMTISLLWPLIEKPLMRALRA